MTLPKPVAVGIAVAGLVVFGLVVYEARTGSLRWQFADTPVAPVVPASTSQVASSANSIDLILHDDPSLLSQQDIPHDTFVPGICGSQVPSTWHARSDDDQAKWNQEGKIQPPTTLSAEDFFVLYAQDEPPVFLPPFKPALYSMAAADTALLGRAEDPGAEDSNRLELDILALPSTEMSELLDATKIAPDGYGWKAIEVDGHQLKVLRNGNPDDKYAGQELVFVPANVFGGNTGLIIFNRSNDWPDPRNVAFRKGVTRFLETVDFASCPSDWLR